MNLRNPPPLVHDDSPGSSPAPGSTPTSAIGPAAISLRGVTKRYKDKCVLDGLDLEIPAGSVTGLLGKNGRGQDHAHQVRHGLSARPGG